MGINKAYILRAGLTDFNIHLLVKFNIFCTTSIGLFNRLKSKIYLGVLVPYNSNGLTRNLNISSRQDVSFVARLHFR